MSDLKKTGKVFLVGAGSGDPGLITVRGAKLLDQAEVVVYDALVNPRLLSYCPQAELIYCGKRAAAHTLTQDQINAVLVEQGQKGRRVVRLKGGDPFVFGRGGEEALALVAAGIPFEVVPGLTAAIAAPAYAGIPVTHRDFNSSFTFITGHEKEEQYQEDAAKAREQGGASDLDWAVIAKLPCISFYMGVKALPRICAKLMEHGMSPDTPAATIHRGTTNQQRTVAGTISTLPQLVIDHKITAPAMTIIGKVVSLRESLNWFESRPLFGQTIVVTRTRQQASDLTSRLEELGASVIEAPTIEIAAPDDLTAVDQALRNLTNYDWVVFTSANGVTYTKQRMQHLGLDARVFAKSKIAAIGDVSAAAVRDELFLNVDLCPARFVAEALGDELSQRNEIKGKRYMLLRADIARPVLRERLKQEGAAEVQDIAVYETRAVKSLPAELDLSKVTWVTFTSSSTAKNFVDLVGADYKEKMKGIKIASIGPITTATLRELGLEPTVQAENFNIEGLVESLRK